MKILIVDDETHITEMFQEFLQVFGHQVDIMNKVPTESIETPYHLVLLDCNLSGQEYFSHEIDYLKYLTTDYAFFFTGAPQRLGSNALKTGQGIIQKPIDLDSLLQLIQLLESKKIFTLRDKKQFRSMGITLLD